MIYKAPTTWFLAHSMCWEVALDGAYRLHTVEVQGHWGSYFKGVLQNFKKDVCDSIDSKSHSLWSHQQGPSLYEPEASFR